MARTKSQPAEVAPVLECCVAHSFDDENGTPVTVPEGMLARADNPIVVAPDLWCEHGAPHDERPTVDFGASGVTTTRPPRAPDGWRRDWHGGGRPWSEQ